MSLEISTAAPGARSAFPAVLTTGAGMRPPARAGSALADPRNDRPEDRRRVGRSPFAFVFARRAWTFWASLGLALAFVGVGGADLDLGPGDARVGLAAIEDFGPMGQTLGYWAPDVWPAEAWPSLGLARFSSGGRPTAALVRWPAALAALLAGLLIAGGAARALGGRAAVLTAVCWFGSLAMIDRSAGAGLDPILGLAVVATIARLLGRGGGWTAGSWAALAFLAGGWPPLALIALVVLVLGRRGAGFSLGLLAPPLLAMVGWSIATISLASVEVWASALTLPLTKGQAWSLAGNVFWLGLPWSPLLVLALARSTRAGWSEEGRRWALGWSQAALAALIAGTFAPGLRSAALMLALAGWLAVVAAALDAAWTGQPAPAARRGFFAVFAALVFLWLIAMAYGSFLWTISMAYYRPVGVAMAFLVLAVAGLSWSALARRDARRAIVVLAVMAAGLKLAHWGYYVPEWNYRRGQGAWGRAVGQWVPRRWPIYTFHDWPDDLAFYIGRRVRQLHGPRYLNHLPGNDSRYVLLLASEFENWPSYAPAVAPLARFEDQYGQERVLARTDGRLPVPGQRGRTQPPPR